MSTNSNLTSHIHLMPFPRLVAIVSIALVMTMAAASSTAAEPAITPELTPMRQGYAFDRPRTLVQQRLFGLAHGVTLLAATCLADGAATKPRETLLKAYSDWDREQTATAEDIQRSLARYYFADQAANAKWLDIAAALNLRLHLDLKPGSLEMLAACDSLPEILKKPRYDLRRQFELQRLAARLSAATRIDAEVAECKSRLPASRGAPLVEAYSRWHRTHDEKIGTARVELEQHWSDAQIDGSLDQWLEQAREKGKRSASRTFNKNRDLCPGLMTFLQHPRADPDDEFDNDR